jgi:flagellin-specific chaperone FliS
MTFNDCLLECVRTPELIKEFDRLSGSNVMEIFYDKRAPIVRMIDDATGYNKILEENKSKDLMKFIEFVYEYVWRRLSSEVINEKDNKI